MSTFATFNNGIPSGQVLVESTGVLRKLQTPPEIMRKLPISGENQQFLYSIYNAFENTKSLTQKDILKKCVLSLLGQNNFSNKDTLIVQCIDLINILNNHLSLFVQNDHIKFNKMNGNKYSINEEHQDFKNFKINNLKFLTVAAHSIEYITKLNAMIDDIAFGFSISSSDNNEEILASNDPNSMQEESITSTETYYIYQSLTNMLDWYLISNDLSTCDCKSFQYCQQIIKSCKHINDLKENSTNLMSYIMVVKEGNFFTECTCGDFKLCKYCDHIDYLNNKYKSK